MAKMSKNRNSVNIKLVNVYLLHINKIINERKKEEKPWKF